MINELKESMQQIKSLSSGIEELKTKAKEAITGINEERRKQGEEEVFPDKEVDRLIEVAGKGNIKELISEANGVLSKYIKK